MSPTKIVSRTAARNVALVIVLLAALLPVVAAPTPARAARVTLQNGMATQGGAVQNLGTLNISNSTVSGNHALFSPGKGGGLWNGGLMTLTNSTVSDNVADDDGGGMEVASGSTTTIVNSTI